MNDESNPRNTAGLWRLAAAAKRAGLSPELFTKACERGEIPVSLVRLGERLVFVRAAELEAWLQPAAPLPEVNLF